MSDSPFSDSFESPSAPQSVADDASLSAVEIRLAQRLASLRSERGWSLDVLAEQTGISRATLARLERGQSSPTTVQLGRLCTAYGLPMSHLIAEAEVEPPQLLRHDEQQVWVDAALGFERRMISPPSSGMKAELIEGYLQPGADIRYDAPPVAGLEQHIWVREGVLEYSLDDQLFRLQAGDCLRFRLYGRSRFVCPAAQPVRYHIVICRP
ncbi:transcriptional regulator [Pokkaliibacter plantistimulans]|uniref:Transcriptional regulator n=1 Tax=Proteobacteria bacterium 228 TaxID=2083153 RepID=A0A2S5KL21_9PROT|nr:helix-turn-helix domain-containing protein [Pokkaliibacter plantistimulans]PPC75343.1 transcriptional regulator [Pokkaliibacter plantistimulans]